MTYISAMPQRTPRIKLFEWRITRIRATPARLIGYVQAPDAEQAVKEAIARYGIDKGAGPAGRAADERDRLDADWPLGLYYRDAART